MMTPMPPATANDAELLRALRAGHAPSFAALYRRHQAPLYRFAVLRCGSAASAADVVQELFLGLLSDRFAYDPLRGPLLHYLFGVARLLILKLEAPLYRNVPLPDPDDDMPEEAAPGATEPLARLLSDETAEEVRRALAALAPAYRDAVILYEIHELSYRDIAVICDVEIGTVRSRLARGRAALARQLAAWRGATA
jgi:RNA polymerase sigma-70 factor (ECF subfamily)